MSWKPEAIALKDRGIAARPTLGQEFEVYASPDEVYEAGMVEVPATDSGILSTEQVGASILSDAPAEVHAVVAYQLQSAVQVVVTLNVTDEDNTVTTAVATFAPPVWVNNQSFNFPEGFGVPLVVTTGKKIKSINSLASVTGGKRGGQIRLLMLPALTSFSRVGCTTQNDFSTKNRPAVPIACGPNGSKYVKQGRSEPGELRVTAKYRSMADDLARLGGMRSTAMVLVRKEGQVLTERLLFGNWVAMVKPNAGDGSDEATMQGEGMYEYFGAFFAS